MARSTLAQVNILEESNEYSITYLVRDAVKYEFLSDHGRVTTTLPEADIYLIALPGGSVSSFVEDNATKWMVDQLNMIT